MSSGGLSDTGGMEYGDSLGRAKLSCAAGEGKLNGSSYISGVLREEEICH